MAKRPTYASVTETLCTCGYLQKAADDPRNPIVFDAQTSEYQFAYQEAECEGLSTLVIYHCPFCGGAAPESKRDLLFAVIPPAEEERLAQLFSSIRLFRDAIEVLGKPNRDDPSGTRIKGLNSVQYFRTMIYNELSDVADVWLTERPDGTVRFALKGKYLGGERTKAVD